MTGLDADRLDLGPVILEIFAEYLALGIVEVRQEQREELAGAMLEHGLVGRIEGGDHRLEQMHLRVLPARRRGRLPLEEATIWRAEFTVEEAEQMIDFGTHLRIVVERVDGREREQDEGVVVRVPLG